MDIYFWNIKNNKKAFDIICNMDFINNPILFSFAEYWDIDSYVNTRSKGINGLTYGIQKRTGFLSSNIDLISMSNYDYYSKVCFNLNDVVIYLFIIHLKAKNYSETNSREINTHYASKIVEEIDQSNMVNSIIIGDFNLSCFDDLMFSHFHFNSTNYFSENLKKESGSYHMDRINFYNPISSFNGDLSKGPPGTYYYKVQNWNQAWHIYDNALVSYSLAKYLEKSKCEIVTELSGNMLLKSNGQPNNMFSDHLPIKISFSIGGNNA